MHRLTSRIRWIKAESAIALDPVRHRPLIRKIFSTYFNISYSSFSLFLFHPFIHSIVLLTSGTLQLYLGICRLHGPCLVVLRHHLRRCTCRLTYFVLVRTMNLTIMHLRRPMCIMHVCMYVFTYVGTCMFVFVSAI